MNHRDVEEMVASAKLQSALAVEEKECEKDSTSCAWYDEFILRGDAMGVPEGDFALASLNCLIRSSPHGTSLMLLVIGFRVEAIAVYLWAFLFCNSLKTLSVLTASTNAQARS